MRYLEEFRDLLARRAARTGERTFGFEYELISSKPVSYEGFRRVKDAVTEAGFVHRNRQLIDDSGMYITFEPGGQIEFSSPPLRAVDVDLFDMLLDRIDGVVEFVKAATGVEYLPKPYIAGRAPAPMLLEAERYKALHELLGRTGDRGREMMKGTAAIHFHAALMNTEELLRLWIFMCSLSREEGFRMGPGREVRLRYAYLVTCTGFETDSEGKVTEIRCTYDPATRGGNAPDGRRVRGTLHWVSAEHCFPAEVRLYDRLFAEENPMKVSDGGDFTDHINPESLIVMKNCMIENHMRTMKQGFICQFERKGYFCIDPDSTEDKMVFNRTISLRDSWARKRKSY